MVISLNKKNNHDAVKHLDLFFFIPGLVILSCIFYNRWRSDSGKTKAFKALPCNPGGGSPSMKKAQARFTSLLFTVPLAYTMHIFGLILLKLNDAWYTDRRRVDQSGPEKFTKEFAAVAFFILPPAARTLFVKRVLDSQKLLFGYLQEETDD